MKRIFSMKMAVLMLFLFGIILGVATFIENDYGTQTARALVYKAKWFEVFQAYFIAILVYNIFAFKSYKTRFPVFLFHMAFVLIALGALITRYVGYEGILHIREGQSSHTMISDVKSLQLEASDGKSSAYIEQPLYLSSMTTNHLSRTLKVGDKKLTISLDKYLPTAKQKVIADPNGKKILELKIAAGGRGDIYYLPKGQNIDFGSFEIGYDSAPSSIKPTFLIKDNNNSLVVKTPFDLSTLNMNDRSTAELKAGINPFKQRLLYQFGGGAIVLKKVYPKAKIEIVSSSLKPKPGKPEYIKWHITVGNQSKDIISKPYKGKMGRLEEFSLGGLNVRLRVGAKQIELPFSIKLNDFQLERYPGSMTPASYASEVTLIDKEKGVNRPFRIYMNHILDYRNYRVFQSSYDPDERGTVLSVNHDPGTLPTYIGYLILAIGMLWSLFTPNGRFQKLLKGARKLQDGALVVMLVVASFVAVPSLSRASSLHVDTKTLEHMKRYSKEHTDQFARLVVQDFQGRMKPMDTLAQEIVSKITGKIKPFGLDPSQIMLGMIMEPDFYQQIPMIKIGHPKIALQIGLPKDTKYAKFSDFFDKKTSAYKLYNNVVKSSRLKPLEKSAYDKELAKVDERVNVAYMAYQGSLMKIFPKPNDANNKWSAPLEAIKTFPKAQSDFVKLAMQAYFQTVQKALKSGDWKNADIALKGIQLYQKKYGSAVMPSPTHIDMEIYYNKLGIFSKLFPVYIMLGLILLFFAFVNVLKPSFSMKWIMRISWAVLLIAFVLHIVGMGIRWYIAGHAPWSNAYESIIFIAAATVLAGIILARRSPFALAGTALLAGFTMLVAHLNFINPEITNLVPVLKSYWLMIHVATIISGDGFLGLGSVLALFVLILYIIRGKNGNANIDRSIKELSNLSEMGLMMGLILMTVGNFLGGVWANESWGRYWGWDPKETWAAVTILVYAGVLHLRFVPALRSNFIYNVAATWAYSTVLMTYFGVNYYLSGLHSYAAGDPVPIPAWVYYAIATLLAITLLAARNRNIDSSTTLSQS